MAAICRLLGRCFKVAPWPFATPDPANLNRHSKILAVFTLPPAKIIKAVAMSQIQRAELRRRRSAMKDGYLTARDAHAAVLLGGILGAVIVFVLFVLAVEHDELCIRLRDGTTRCVVLTTRPAK